MKYSDDQFRELEDQLRLTDQSKDQLRSKILQSAHENKKRYIKHYVWLAAACVIFIITTPIYSSTMASIASKISPIKIPSTFTNEPNDSDMTTRLFELVEKEGYTVNSVGVTPSPYTVEVSLILKDSSLQHAADNLKPLITDYLYENGYDEFELKVLEAPEAPPSNDEDKSNLYEQIRQIVKAEFETHGYAEEAGYELAGLKNTLFSNIVTIEMPDHIKEQTKIVEGIKREFELKNLDVKDIEVNTFNLKHRQQDDRWGYISMEIYNAMAGKSTYKLTGVSYKVKKGHSTVSIKTDLGNPPAKEIIQEVEREIEKFLDLPEMKQQTQNDTYTIKLLLKNEQSFIEITN